MPSGQLVGRERELERLRRILGVTASGSTATVLIEGEAGIGKTRLLEGLIEFARPAGTTVVRGEGHPLERTRPFGVLIDALGLRRASPDPRRAALGRLLIGEVSSEAGQFAVNQLQFRAIEEIIDVIEVASDGGPVLIVLDDLHWADSSTLLAFRWMVRELTEVPVMLVAALRPSPRGPELAVLVDDCLSGGAELIELEPLDVDEVAALVRAELGVPAGAGLTAAVGRAAGNPLWVVETVRTMASRGLLDLSGPMAEAASVELPDSLRHLVMRRLGYLPEATARTLRSASLLGDSFSLADLATITGRRAAELLEDLREAIDAGLVAESAGAFVFRHQLVRDAIYEDVPETARVALHREAAAALEAAGAPLTQVASHLILGAVAGDVGAAASLRRAAGDAAPRAPAIAAELLRRAVRLLPEDDPERDAIQTELAEALLGAGENVQAGALASELLAHPLDPELGGRLRFVLIVVLSLQGGDERLDLEVEAVLQESPEMPPAQQARLLGHSSFGRTFSGDFSGAERVARQALELAERGSDDAMSVWTMCALSTALMAQGRIDEELTILRDALRRAREAPGGMDRMGNPRFIAGMYFTDADLFDEADQLVREAAAECETTPSSATTLPDVNLAAAQLRFVAGDWSEVAPELEGAIAFASERGNMVMLARARSYLALIAIARGELADAERALETAEVRFAHARPGFDAGLVRYAEAMLAEAVGEPGRALDLLRDAWKADRARGGCYSARAVSPPLVRLCLEFSEDGLAREVADAMEHAATFASAVPSVQSAAARCRGLIEQDPARMQQAVELARRSRRMLDLAATCEDAAAVLASCDRPADAQVLASEAIDRYEALGAGWHAARANAALRAFGGRRGVRGRRKRDLTGWGSLTKSELAVAELVTEGLTNREIGKRLFISPHTVNTHLRHCFQKLDVNTRSALAVTAQRASSDEASTKFPEDHAVE